MKKVAPDEPPSHRIEKKLEDLSRRLNTRLRGKQVLFGGGPPAAAFQDREYRVTFNGSIGSLAQR